MKPAKKQNGDSNNNEKQISDKTQKSKIKTYFKSAPKSFVVEDRITTPGGSKDKTKEFYVRMLKEKLQSEINFYRENYVWMFRFSLNFFMLRG